MPILVILLGAIKVLFILLWLFAILAYFYMRKNHAYSYKKDYNKKALNKTNIGKILVPYLVSICVLFIATYYFYNDKLLFLPINMPHIWLMVMVFYPLLSVPPQEIIYRSFIFRRYKHCFSDNQLTHLSALTFGFGHIIFQNLEAVILSTIAGYIFALRYKKGRALSLVIFEHAIYGMLIFTVGLGYFFYRGSISTTQIIAGG